MNSGFLNGLHFLRCALVYVLLAALSVQAAHATEEQQDHSAEVDYLALAARLISDGNYDRARTTLLRLDPDSADLEKGRYYTLKGLIALRQEQPQEAMEALQQALNIYAARAKEKAGKQQADALQQDSQRAHLYMAQAAMGAKKYRRALRELDAGGEVADAIPAVHQLRAQAHWELKDYGGAFAALDRGSERFAGDYRFLRAKVFYAIHLGLYQHAAELGQRYLTLASPQPQDVVAIGSALRKSGQTDAALALLERARLNNPQDRDLTVELAHAWLDKEQPVMAADLFAEAAIYHQDLRLEAAELQRRAGRFHRALLLNAAVADQARKYRQRLGILVAMESWEQAALMGDALRRNGLMAEDEIRYAYAYALFRTGDYNSAGQVLSGISHGEAFRRATALRQAMERCREASWQCL